MTSERPSPGPCARCGLPREWKGKFSIRNPAAELPELETHFYVCGCSRPVVQVLRRVNGGPWEWREREVLE